MAHAGPFDEAALIEAVRSGASYHRAALSLLAHWAHQGTGMLEAEAGFADCSKTCFRRIAITVGTIASPRSWIFAVRARIV